MVSIFHAAKKIHDQAISGWCSIWDIAAAKLIIEESGGIMVNLQGNSFNLNSSNPDKSYQDSGCASQIIAYQNDMKTTYLLLK